MTPEDEAQLRECVETIAAILYRNTPPEQLKMLESIEHTLREQTQQTVLPQLGVFLLQPRLKQQRAIDEP